MGRSRRTSARYTRPEAMEEPLVPPELQQAGLLALPSTRPVIGFPSKEPFIVDGLGLVSSVSQYRNAATTSTGMAPAVVHGTTLADGPMPRVQGTPLMVMAAVARPLTPVPRMPTLP